MQNEKQRASRFANIRKQLKQMSVVNKNSQKVEAKEEKIRTRRNSLQLAIDIFQSQKLLRKFSDEDEEEEKNMLNPFDENYTLLDKIGEGANGMVYTCQHKKTGKIYAAKVVVRMDEEHCLQLKKNFIAIKALRHASIIRYRALYIDLVKHSAYLVMEYFPCKNLLDLEIKNESEMRYIFTELLNALSYMHQRNVCHRDIKPQNILYDPMMKRLKVIDFGISKKTFERGQRRDMLTIIGTYFYLAPQILNGGGYDEKVDLWSAGVTLYQMVTGVTPFQSQYHSDTVNNITKGKIIFETEPWDNYSFFIKDMVCRLLKPKEERLSAKEALIHLWITQSSPTKSRRGSDKTEDVRFGRHDSGKFRVYRVQEEKVNEKYATHKQQGQQDATEEQTPKSDIVRPRPFNICISKDRFDPSDSGEEETEPETAKRRSP